MAKKKPVKSEKADEQAQKPATPGPTLTSSQAAGMLNRSVRWFYNLVEAGYIEKATHGAYPLVNVVRGVLAYMEDQIAKANKSAASARATDARTREIELRIKQKERDLIPLDEAQSIIAEVGAMFRSEFAGLPARYTRDMTERRRLESEVDASFTRIAAIAEKKSANLANSGDDTEAEPEV